VIIVVGGAIPDPAAVLERWTGGDVNADPDQPASRRNREAQPRSRRLMHTWVGVPPSGPVQRAVADHVLPVQQVAVNANYVYGQDSFTSEVSVAGRTPRGQGAGERLRPAGDGRYTWSLSPGGTLLHRKVDDACAEVGHQVPRLARGERKDQTGVCWGDLEPAHIRRCSTGLDWIHQRLPARSMEA
jgi:hypothetical protein